MGITAKMIISSVRKKFDPLPMMDVAKEISSGLKAGKKKKKKHVRLKCEFAY